MIDISKPNWFVEIPDETEHTTRIMSIVDVKQYLLRQHKILQRQDYNFQEQVYKTAKTVLNSIKSIVNFHVAYTIGTPIELQGNSEIVNAFNRIIKRGGYNKVDYELVEDLIKYGNSYEYIYVTTDGNIKSKVIAPEDAYPVYDDNYQYVAFLEYWEDSKTQNKNYIVYYPDRVDTWQNNTLISTNINLSGLPIHYASLDKSEYNHFGDIGLLDLIVIMDAIEKLLAKLDDAITKLSLNPIGVASGQSLHESNINSDVVGAVISLEDGGTFGYANSIMDYQNIKFLLETYIQQFYAVAQVPESLIGSASISNISEVTLKLMLTQTDNKASQNIHVLNDGIYKRLSIFNKLMKYVGYSEFDEDAFDTVKIVFNKNRPSDSTTVMSQIKTQWEMNAISRKTILDISPFIIDTQLELDRLAEEGTEVKTAITNVVNVGTGMGNGGISAGNSDEDAFTGNVGSDNITGDK